MRHRQVHGNLHPVSLCFIVPIAWWSAYACSAVSLACRLSVTQTTTAADIKALPEYECRPMQRRSSTATDSM